jgi:hypothetical protein
MLVDLPDHERLPRPHLDVMHLSATPSVDGMPLLVLSYIRCFCAFCNQRLTP